MEHAQISRQEEAPTISLLAHQLFELQAAVAHRHQDPCSEDSLQPADVRPRCRTTPAKQSQQQKPVWIPSGNSRSTSITAARGKGAAAVSRPSSRHASPEHCRQWASSTSTGYGGSGKSPVLPATSSFKAYMADDVPDSTPFKATRSSHQHHRSPVKAAGSTGSSSRPQSGTPLSASDRSSSPGRGSSPGRSTSPNKNTSHTSSSRFCESPASSGSNDRSSSPARNSSIHHQSSPAQISSGSRTNSPARGSSPLRASTQAFGTRSLHAHAEHLHNSSSSGTAGLNSSTSAGMRSSSSVGMCGDSPYTEALQLVYGPTAHATPAQILPKLKAQAAKALRASCAGRLQHRSSSVASANASTARQSLQLPARQQYLSAGAPMLQQHSHASLGCGLGSGSTAASSVSAMGAAVIAAAVAAMMRPSTDSQPSQAIPVVVLAPTSEEMLRGYTSGYIDGRLAAFRTGSSSGGGSWGSRRGSSSGGASAQVAQLSRHSSSGNIGPSEDPSSVAPVGTPPAGPQIRPDVVKQFAMRTMSAALAVPAAASAVASSTQGLLPAQPSDLQYMPTQCMPMHSPLQVQQCQCSPEASPPAPQVLQQEQQAAAQQSLAMVAQQQQQLQQQQQQAQEHALPCKEQSLPGYSVSAFDCEMDAYLIPVSHIGCQTSEVFSEHPTSTQPPREQQQACLSAEAAVGEQLMPAGNSSDRSSPDLQLAQQQQQFASQQQQHQPHANAEADCSSMPELMQQQEQSISQRESCRQNAIQNSTSVNGGCSTALLASPQSPCSSMGRIEELLQAMHSRAEQQLVAAQQLQAQGQHVLQQPCAQQSQQQQPRRPLQELQQQQHQGVPRGSPAVQQHEALQVQVQDSAGQQPVVQEGRGIQSGHDTVPLTDGAKQDCMSAIASAVPLLPRSTGSLVGLQVLERVLSELRALQASAQHQTAVDQLQLSKLDALMAQVVLLNHWLVERCGSEHPIASQLALLQQDLQAWRSRLGAQHASSTQHGMPAALSTEDAAVPAVAQPSRSPVQAMPAAAQPSSPRSLQLDPNSLQAMHSPRTPQQQSPLPDSSPKVGSAPERQLCQLPSPQLLAPIQSGGLLRSRNMCSPRSYGPSTVLPPVLEGRESDCSTSTCAGDANSADTVSSSGNSIKLVSGPRDNSILAAFSTMLTDRPRSAGRGGRSQGAAMAEMQPPAELPDSPDSQGQHTQQQSGEEHHFCIPAVKAGVRTTPCSCAGSIERASPVPSSPTSRSPGSMHHWRSPTAEPCSDSPTEPAGCRPSEDAAEGCWYGGDYTSSCSGAGRLRASYTPAGATGASETAAVSTSSPSSADTKRGFMLALKQTLQENMSQIGGKRGSPGRLSKEGGRVVVRQLAAEAMQKAVQRKLEH